jgi:hypothetical protein
LLAAQTKAEKEGLTLEHLLRRMEGVNIMRFRDHRVGGSRFPFRHFEVLIAAMVAGG